MATGHWTRTWQQRMAEAEAQTRAQVRQTITYIDQQIVPELRRDGLQWMRSAARELHRLAAALDSAAAAPGRNR